MRHGYCGGTPDQRAERRYCEACADVPVASQAGEAARRQRPGPPGPGPPGPRRAGPPGKFRRLASRWPSLLAWSISRSGWPRSPASWPHDWAAPGPPAPPPPDSDWDFGLYYDGSRTLRRASPGWAGRAGVPRRATGARSANGGAWLTVDGTRVDLIYRDLAQVRYWTAEAQAGRFEIQREVGYVAGIATYILAGELALGRVLAGDLPRPAFPDRLRETAPAAWSRLAAGALQFAAVHAGRGDRVACLANLTQATLATAQARMAAAGEWVLNEKRLVARAGLEGLQYRIADLGQDLPTLVSAVCEALGLRDDVWGAG